MKKLLSLTLAIVMVLTLFSAVTVSAAEKVVIYFEDASHPNFIEQNTTGKSINAIPTSEQLDDGNYVYRMLPTIISYIKKPTSGTAAAENTAAYHRLSYMREFDNITVGVPYTISYRYKYVDKNGNLNAIDSPENYVFITDRFAKDPASGWSYYKSEEVYKGMNGSGTPALDEATGWIEVNKAMKINSNKLKNSSGTVITSTTLNKLYLNLKKGFNGVLADEIDAAIEAYPNSYTDARKVLSASVADRNLAILVDYISLTAELEEDQIAMVSVSAQNAKVKINGVATETGEKVGIGYTSEIEIEAEEGYELKSVKIDGEEQNIVGNKVAVNHVFSADANVEVVSEKPFVAPAIEDVKTVARLTNDDTYGPTVYVYSQISDFTSEGAGLDYGIKFWKTATPAENFILTARVDNAGTLAKAVPGQPFIIKVCGDYINVDESYTAQPFVGDIDGTAKEIE